MKNETTGHREADVFINGKHLTFSQSMTLRVAISSMLMDMAMVGAMGTDQVGERIREGYRERLIEIQALINEP